MKKAIALSLVALVLALVSLTLRTFARNAELDTLRAENASLSAELEAVKADAEAAAAEATQEPVATLYARTAKITDIDYAADTLTVVDGAGLIWRFFGCEDYDTGDLVSLLMSDAGTPESIMDDIIISVTYAGCFD